MCVSNVLFFKCIINTTSIFDKHKGLKIKAVFINLLFKKINKTIDFINFCDYQ